MTFGNGGQRDIIDHGETGLIVDRTADVAANARAMAAAIARGAKMLQQDADAIRRRMYTSVRDRFSAEAVARAYLRLLREDVRVSTPYQIF